MANNQYNTALEHSQSLRSFLLRVWQPHETAPWLFQVKSIDGLQMETFARPAELVAFLMEGSREDRE